METGVIAAARTVLHWWATAGQGRTDTPLPEAARAAAWQLLGLDPSSAGMPPPIQGPLESIFNRVAAKGAAQQPPPVYLRPAPLAMQREVLFPVAQGSAPATSPNDLAALSAAVARIEGERLSAEMQLEALFYALQRHGWSLPSPLAAVSLFDFARTHAAVAAAQAAGGPGLFLLGGDLSGVQSFLYTLTADGATKNLRGRSFYLQLLTEVCARRLLRVAGLPLTNLLYAGGGRFYLLFPHQVAGKATKEWLTAQQADFDTFFLRRHQGDLYLALGGGELSPDALLDQGEDRRFSEAWGRATEAINAAKRRRFAALEDNLHLLFAPHGGGGREEVACTVCDYQGTPAELHPIPDDPLGRHMCVLCESFEDLGRMLHNAEYLLLRHIDRPSLTAEVRELLRQPWHELLSELGTHVQLRSDTLSLHESGNRHPSWLVRWTTVLALDANAAERDEQALAAYLPLAGPLVRGIRPVANTSPTVHPSDLTDWDERKPPDEPPPRPGDVKPFSLMVEQSEGVKRLGVLRMDVDDLGDLFRYRLDGGLARVSALSAALALFFEGWVGVLCDQRNTAPPERVYSIYSGGDDLFIVGSWDLLPALAREISDDLAAYTGHNPAVHLSAGISLHGAKFPLYQAADAADAELKRAKARPGKAALGWLEQVVGWEYADDLFATAATLYRYTTAPDGHKPPVSRAILQTLQTIYAQYADGLDDPRRKLTSRHYTIGPDGKRRKKTSRQLFFGPWLWLGAYQLKRVAEQVEKRLDDYGAIQEWLKGLREGLLGGAELPPNTGGRVIERVGLAARWTQLRIRKERE